MWLCGFLLFGVRFVWESKKRETELEESLVYLKGEIWVVLWESFLSSHGPVFPGSYDPHIYMAHNGNMTKGPMFPSSTYVLSQSPLFPRSYFPKFLCSQGPIVPQLYRAHNGNLKKMFQVQVLIVAYNHTGCNCGEMSDPSSQWLASTPRGNSVPSMCECMRDKWAAINVAIYNSANVCLRDT